MYDLTWGLAGIGRLGKAMMTRCDREGLPLLVYHPDRERREEAVAGVRHRAVSLSELAHADAVLLALPPGAMETFLFDLSEAVTDSSPKLINISTKDRTGQLQERWPQFTFTGVKLAGHAKAFEEAGEALFVSDAWENEPDVKAFFNRLGTTRPGAEDETEHFNRLVTNAAVTAAVRLERDLEQAGFGADYRESALAHMVPQIIRAYERDELGAFADAIRRAHKDES